MNSPHRRRGKMDKRMVSVCLGCTVAVELCDGGMGETPGCRHFQLYGEQDEIPIVQESCGKRERNENFGLEHVSRAASRVIKEMFKGRSRGAWVRLSEIGDEDA